MRNKNNVDFMKNSQEIGNAETIYPCSPVQLLAIFIPLLLIGIFCAIFFPLYRENNKGTQVIRIRNNSTDNIPSTDSPIIINTETPTNINTDIPNITNSDTTIINSTGNETESEFDEFDAEVVNYTYAILTPKNGYDTIFVFLGGIAETSDQYFEFFQSNSTIIPKKTKIYSLAGKIRNIKYLEKYNITTPAPCWFNVDSVGTLICDGCDDIFDEAKESLNIVLDTIDKIAADEKISYDKIFLGGFSQGAIMTNYVLLNSRHELGGYTAFSGYILDHNFPYNYVVYNMSETQKQIIESKKNYHILATHSFNDQNVPYPNSVEAYYTYFREYTDFNLYSFGALLHVFTTQPVLPYARMWLKERMGK